MYFFLVVRPSSRDEEVAKFLSRLPNCFPPFASARAKRKPARYFYERSLLNVGLVQLSCVAFVVFLNVLIGRAEFLVIGLRLAFLVSRFEFTV